MSDILLSRLQRHATRLLFLLLAAGLVSAVAADEPAPSVIAQSVEYAGVVRSAIGVTRQGTRIDLFLQREDVDLHTSKMRLLLIGGLDGDRRSVDAALNALRWFHNEDSTHGLRQQFTLSAIPCVNPMAWQTASDVAENPDLTLGYPPSGKAYHNALQSDEAFYLWRWLGVHAPDLVIDLRVAPRHEWQVPETLAAELVKHLRGAQAITTTGDLIVELGRNDVCQTGRIPAIRLQTPASDTIENLESFLPQLRPEHLHTASRARLTLQRRLDRTPTIVARQLAEQYGHDLKQVVYIPAIALIGQLRLGKLRLGELDGDPAALAVRRIVKPYVDGNKSSRPTSGSGLSGHLIFSELAAMSQGAERARYIELARTAADLAFDESGKIKPIMPFHNEMSDAAFMGGPILAAVGRLTNDDRYFRACAIHQRSVRELVLREDGLYRHSPLDEAAWGRGNGFPALALAMCLTDFPADHPDRSLLLEHFQRHLRALAGHQDPTGCWHQVIDRPESYRELSSTCMISYAIARGIRSGWLDAKEFRPVLDRAWYAIRTRVAEDGQLVDVCTGTGKQPSLRAYYDRTAILGRDARGGAMALLVATELAASK